MTVVISDGARFHVLRTDVASLGDRVAPPENPIGWFIVEIVEPRSATRDPRLAYEAVRDADAAEQPRMFRRLMVEWTHLTMKEVAWASGPLDDSGIPADAVAGKTNIVRSLDDANGRTGPSKIDPVSGTMPRAPTVCISSRRFAQGAGAVRETLLHEMRHAYHIAQTLGLVRQWRAERTEATLEAWDTWLKRHRRHLESEVSGTAWALTHEEYGQARTETYAHVHSFIYVYRRLSEARADPDTLPASARLSLHGEMAGLTTLGREWEAVGSGETTSDSMDLLVRELRGLSTHHREHVRRFISVQRRVINRPPERFFAELLSRLGSG